MTATSVATVEAGAVSIPRIGLGTFRMASDSARDLVGRALEIGYRHVDTAMKYDNERAVGAAVRECAVPRAQIFVTSKFAHTEAAPADAVRAARTSIDTLGLDYVDLFLLHWPNLEIPPERTFAALLPLVDEGVIRALGMSNAPVALLRRALSAAPIAAVQVEHHPYLAQRALMRFTAEHGLCLTAYAPFAEGRVFSDPVLVDIARKHGRSAGQVTLRWLLDEPRTAVIPKTARVERLAENLDVVGFDLDDDDRRRIAELADSRQRFFDPPWGPEWDAF